MREAWCELGNIRQTVEGWSEDFVTAFQHDVNPRLLGGVEG